MQNDFFIEIQSLLEKNKLNCKILESENFSQILLIIYKDCLNNIFHPLNTKIINILFLMLENAPNLNSLEILLHILKISDNSEISTDFNKIFTDKIINLIRKTSFFPKYIELSLDVTGIKCFYLPEIFSNKEKFNERKNLSITFWFKFDNISNLETNEFFIASLKSVID